MTPRGRLSFAIAALAVAGALVMGCGPKVDANAVTVSASNAAQALDRNHPTPYQRTNEPTAAAPSDESLRATAPGLTLGGGKAGAPAQNKGAPTTGTMPTPPPATNAADDESAAPVDAPAKISARHVLIQWMGSGSAGKSVMRTRDQAQVVAQEVLRRAKAGEDVGRLAVEYSDEPNAASRGGSLGRFSRGQMVPAFDQVAFKLRVGQISGIVETPFGFHIIQRTE